MQKKINNYYSNKEIKIGGYYTFENVFHISFLLRLLNLSISGRNTDRCKKVIVSGHQRVRACKELGKDIVMVDVKIYDNEDDILKDMLLSNLNNGRLKFMSDRKKRLYVFTLEKLGLIKDDTQERKAVSDNTYSLLTGERRIKALKLLGYKQVEVRTWKSLNDEEKLNIEISENEARKDFSKSERMEYALRLAKIESIKARERMESGIANPRQKSVEGRTDNTIASKLGIGSRDTYRKEKYIYENQSTLPPEDFVNWDEGRLSTNKAYQQIKAKLQQQEEQLKTKQDSVDLLKT